MLISIQEDDTLKGDLPNRDNLDAKSKSTIACRMFGHSFFIFFFSVNPQCMREEDIWTCNKDTNTFGFIATYMTH